MSETGSDAISNPGLVAAPGPELYPATASVSVLDLDSNAGPGSAPHPIPASDQDADPSPSPGSDANSNPDPGTTLDPALGPGPAPVSGTGYEAVAGANPNPQPGPGPDPDPSVRSRRDPEASGTASGDETPLERIESALTEGAAHMAAALCRWLGDLAAFDRRQGWASWGCRSAAHWLTFRCGVDLPAAREQTKVAARLTELPRIRQAFAQGALSWWQVRQLTRVATPQTDQQLLDLARAATTTQLTAIVSGLKRALALDAGLHPRRSFRWWVDEDGFVVFSGRLGPDDGALVAKTLDALVDDLLRAKRQRTLQAAAHVPDTPEDPPGEADDPVGATRADALVRMARLALAASKPGTTSKPATGDEPAPDIADRAQVVVHVDHAVLMDAPAPTVAPGERPAHDRGSQALREDGLDEPGLARGPDRPSVGHPASEHPDPQTVRPDPSGPEQSESHRAEAGVGAVYRRLAGSLRAPAGSYSEARCEIEGGPAIPPRRHCGWPATPRS